MRQAVQALVVATLDVPAEIATADLPAIISDALRTGSHAVAKPVGCLVRSVREEAAIFDNNRDQWVVGPHGIYKSDAPQFCIGFAYSQGFGQPFPDRDAMPGRIATALNFMAGAVPPPVSLGLVAALIETARDLVNSVEGDIFTDAEECEGQVQEVLDAAEEVRNAIADYEKGAPAPFPAGLVETFAWALGMATEAISLRENSDDDEDTDSDTLAMHREELAKGGAMLEALRRKGGAA